MDNYVAKALIIRLKEGTMESDIIWNRFSTNIDIYDPENSLIRDFILSMEGYEVYSQIYSEERVKIDLKNSYFADHRGGRVFLFCIWLAEGIRKTIMALQGRVDANLFLIAETELLDQVLEFDDEIQEELIDLIATIAYQVDSPKDYIDRIISR